MNSDSKQDSLPDELQEVEAALQALTPRTELLDESSLLYAAGKADAKRELRIRHRFSLLCYSTSSSLLSAIVISLLWYAAGQSGEPTPNSQLAEETGESDGSSANPTEVEEIERQASTLVDKTTSGSPNDRAEAFSKPKFAGSNLRRIQSLPLASTIGGQNLSGQAARFADTEWRLRHDLPLRTPHQVSTIKRRSFQPQIRNSETMVSGSQDLSRLLDEF